MESWPGRPYSLQYSGVSAVESVDSDPVVQEELVGLPLYLLILPSFVALCLWLGFHLSPYLYRYRLT